LALWRLDSAPNPGRDFTNSLLDKDLQREWALWQILFGERGLRGAHTETNPVFVVIPES
jgi:hypothetical protein